jgi:O-antigen ligase
VQSNRYEYWRVGARAFVEHPLRGLGTAGFRAAWVQQRRITEGVRDAHSIELETAAELGVVGLIGLALLLGGVASAARSSLRRRPELVVGWCGGCAAWLVHASIDWDWEMPAVTLPVIVMAGALIAAAEGDPAPIVAPNVRVAAAGPRRTTEVPATVADGRPLDPVHRLRSPPSPSRGPVR